MSLKYEPASEPESCTANRTDPCRGSANADGAGWSAAHARVNDKVVERCTEDDFGSQLTLEVLTLYRIIKLLSYVNTTV